MIRLLLGILILVGPVQAQGRHEFTELHLGVAVRLVVHAPTEALARPAARAAFDRIAQLEQVFSDYRPTSELRQLQAAGAHWTPVSPELFEVLALGRHLAVITEGAFDPTIGPLVLLWRAARRSGHLPDSAALDRARSLVGWNAIELDSVRRAVRLARPGIQLDLGGIAKGYILGQALTVLRAHGLGAALLEAGGDIVLGDPPPDRLGWTVEVAGMAPGPLRQVAVATSGSSEQFIEVEGVRYGHLIDPRTGLGVTTGYQATVIGPDAATADALASALAVVGPSGTTAWFRQFPGYRAVVTVPGWVETTAASRPPQID